MSYHSRLLLIIALAAAPLYSTGQEPTAEAADNQTERSADFSPSRDQRSSLVLNLISQHNIRFLHLNFTDLFGNPHSYTISTNMAEHAFRDGIKFDGSSINGYANINASDMTLVPDPDTFSILPWTHGQQTAAQIICDITHNDGTPYEGCPRTMLRRLCNEYEEKHNLQMMVSPELEFFLIPEKAYDTQTHTFDLKQLDNRGYCARSITDPTLQIKQGILEVLRMMNMHPEKTHHEVAPNQHEITLRYCPALKMADNLITTKNVIHFFAQQFGYRAFFMPKPFRDENGSGMHINYSLYNTQTKENAFFDPSGRYLLSDTAHSFIAGNLAVMRESAALFNSTVNSYKRLVRGFEAPVFVSWGNKNRTAQIRIPEVALNQGKAVRAELRSPDVMGNPYLMFAALYVSGMEGVRQRLVAPAEADDNLYLLSRQERLDRGIEELPRSLEEALVAMKASVFLPETLGSHIFTAYLAGKQAELRDYDCAVTDWELQRYGTA